MGGAGGALRSFKRANVKHIVHCVHAFQTGYGRVEKVLSMGDVIVLMNFSIRDGLLSAQHASVQRVAMVLSEVTCSV